MVTTAGVFPYRLAPLNNVSAFTYRTGTTFAEMLEDMRVYLNETMRPEFNTEIERILTEFQAGIANAEAHVIASETEYNDLMADAKAYVDASIQFINNKTGQAQIQRVTLTGPYTVTIDPLWPNNHPINIVLTQDATGGRSVTWDSEDINGSVPVNTAPNAETDFWLVPEGDGTWTALQYVDKSAYDAAISRRAIIVTSFSELQAAVNAGGIIRGGNTPITITTQLEITQPTRIDGGNFILPADAAYSAFRITSDNVTITNARFTGPGTGTGINRLDGARFIHAQGTAAAYLRNIKITGNTMTGNQDENIRLAYVRDSIVSNNSIDNFLYAGIMLLSVEDSNVDSNVITNAVMKTPVVNVYGVAATDITNQVATRSRNIKITGNTIRGIDWEGIDTHGGDGIIITGNSVESCARGIALVVGNDDRLTTPQNCVVSGNHVDKGTNTTPDREGISLYGLSSNFATAVITGNIVKGYPDDKSITVSQYDARRTLIEGNSHPHIPWTLLNMDNGNEWLGSSTFPPMYMVDGRTVHIRGMVTPTGTQTTAKTRLAGIPTVARPGALTFYKQTRGANSASSTNATIAADPAGEISMYYRNNTNDFYSYPIDGSYQRDYLGAQ